MALSEAAIARFWAKVANRGGDGCWEWTGSTNGKGYGHFRPGVGERASVHRFSYTLATGESADGKVVCHRCDNRRCVRPDHLFLGEHADNVRDRNEKERQARGVMVNTHKLTEDEVREARRDHGADPALSWRSLGRRYRVHDVTIRRAVLGLSWKHVAA